MTKTPAPGRRIAMRVQDFASGKKGVTRAIQEFKVRKQRKIQEKAALLRKYKKVVKKEGYERKPEEEKQKPTPKSILKSEPQNAKRALEGQREAKQQHREKQERKRQQLCKDLSKRTRKGQPIMKHVIHNILEKLQKENSDS
jgi:hypothetical protein